MTQDKRTKANSGKSSLTISTPQRKSLRIRSKYQREDIVIGPNLTVPPQYKELENREGFDRILDHQPTLENPTEDEPPLTWEEVAPQTDELRFINRQEVNTVVNIGMIPTCHLTKGTFVAEGNGQTEEEGERTVRRELMRSRMRYAGVETIEPDQTHQQMVHQSFNAKHVITMPKI